MHLLFRLPQLQGGARQGSAAAQEDRGTQIAATTASQAAFPGFQPLDATNKRVNLDFTRILSRSWDMAAAETPEDCAAGVAASDAQSESFAPNGDLPSVLSSVGVDAHTIQQAEDAIEDASVSITTRNGSAAWQHVPSQCCFAGCA